MVRAGGVVYLGWGWQPPDLRAPSGAPAGRINRRSAASTRELRRRTQGDGERATRAVCGVWCVGGPGSKGVIIYLFPTAQAKGPVQGGGKGSAGGGSRTRNGKQRTGPRGGGDSPSSTKIQEMWGVADAVAAALWNLPSQG